MRLKHWQGYGAINAKRVEFKMNRDGTNTVKIQVTGRHECGLVRNDRYDVHNWLMKRFVKDCPDYRTITDLDVSSPDDETAVYAVTYRPEAK